MAAESSALDELHSELTCPVCLDLFTEPVILECGHHFCITCIRRCWEAKADESTGCPKCRKTCARPLRPNSLLCNVVESVRRARATDAKRHERAPKSPPCSGKRRGGSESDSDTETGAGDVTGTGAPGSFCPEHEEKLKLFCEDDQVAVCLVCGMSREHRTHTVIPIGEAYENYKEQLSDSLRRVECQIKTASQCQIQTNDKILLLKEHAAALERQVNDEFQQLKDFLSRQEKERRTRLRQAKEERLKKLDDSLTHTTTQLSQLELSKHLIQSKLSQEQNPAILTEIKDFIESAECDFEPPDEVCADLPAGEFVGPLQYHVWRNMNSILGPGVEAVTFDPLTAYPRLWVSECARSVCVGKIQAGLPNNPERFTLYNIVLGAQAFSEGRHYWEVQVGEKTAWGLGVARASVKRKEELTLCPEEGFWTLVLNEHGYEACTSADVKPLKVVRPPRRVGVYLDYDRGQVSFYDAEDMTHLFTFSHSHFTEPVYPYFNPWPIMNGRNREPLIIHTPQL